MFIYLYGFNERYMDIVCKIFVVVFDVDIGFFGLIVFFLEIVFF